MTNNLKLEIAILIASERETTESCGYHYEDVTLIERENAESYKALSKSCKDLKQYLEFTKWLKENGF